MLLCFSGATLAQTECPRRWKPWEPQRTAVYYAPAEAAQPVPTVHVAGEVATDLLFPEEVDPGRTKLIGDDRRFEPLMIAGRSVVLVPGRDLADGESFSLIVTLRSGLTIPFNLRSPRSTETTDGQVDVYVHLEDATAVRRELQMARSRVEALTAENDRHVQEEVSVDHALAALLVQGRTDLTPFTEAGSTVLREDGADLKIVTFRPRKPDTDPGMTAVVVHVTNSDPRAPWSLDEIRLMSASSGDMKPFAMRNSAQSIAPGRTGTIAVVMDADTFGKKRKEHLVLEVWKAGPARVAAIDLAMVDARSIPIRIQGRAKSQ